MKHYIILTGGIHNMGGSEMYTRNKIIYLKTTGWHVNVFFYNRGEKIYLKELEEFKNNCIPELQNGYYYFSKIQRNSIVDRIYSGIDSNDYVVIESQLIELTYWAELVAFKYGAKSILNCLEENIHQISYKASLFFEYKVKRNEILNGSEKSYRRYFGKYVKQEYCNYVNSMTPLCSNVISNDTTEISLPEADFNLLSIGRLDKPYIQNVIDGINKYILANDTKTFNLLFVGGSPDGSVEKQIDDVFSDYVNVNIVQYGYIFPIPANLIQQADVAMATSNSVLVSANLGIPTIAYSIHDFMPLGVYGFTTNNKILRDDEPIIKTEILLDEILNQHKYKKDLSHIVPQQSIDEVFKPQIDFLDKSPNDHDAYNVMKIHSLLERLVANSKRIFLNIIGRPIYMNRSN